MAFTEPTETLVNYPLNGSNRRFSIPFDYLQRSFIRVSLFAANKEEQLTLGVDFNFINDTTIETVKTYGGADGWTRIQLRRYTDAKRIVEFIDGSVLLAGDLNVATLQALHIAQEGRDSAFDMLTVNSEGNYDAKDRRIVRIANGIDDHDAVTMGQFKDWTGKVTTEADRAKKEADRAKSEADKATTNGAAQVELAKKEVEKAAAQAGRAESEANRAEQAVITALDPYRSEELTVIAKGGEKRIQLPFLPFNLLVTINGAVQPKGYSYTMEGSMLVLAGEGLLVGEVLYVLMNPPMETKQVIVSADKGNMVKVGTDGGAKLLENQFTYFKEITDVTTEQVE
ncbi:hypothetical protein [Providencia phage PSTCR2]|uniref:Bacteriophage T7 tail fibre protein-like N-terminal domain-containing protein n=1 Tax=Providencia phage PSTCR2 TaxID=2783544 RepID=A0A873WH94_9CAUD|nr:hypothetical protein [Providencia phage PSTCR2]